MIHQTDLNSVLCTDLVEVTGLSPILIRNESFFVNFRKKSPSTWPEYLAWPPTINSLTLRPVDMSDTLSRNRSPSTPLPSPLDAELQSRDVTPTTLCVHWRVKADLKTRSVWSLDLAGPDQHHHDHDPLRSLQTYYTLGRSMAFTNRSQIDRETDVNRLLRSLSMPQPLLVKSWVCFRGNLTPGVAPRHLTALEDELIDKRCDNHDWVSGVHSVLKNKTLKEAFKAGHLLLVDRDRANELCSQVGDCLLRVGLEQPSTRVLVQRHDDTTLEGSRFDCATAVRLSATARNLIVACTFKSTGTLHEDNQEYERVSIDAKDFPRHLFATKGTPYDLKAAGVVDGVQAEDGDDEDDDAALQRQAQNRSQRRRKRGRKGEKAAVEEQKKPRTLSQSDEQNKFVASFLTNDNSIIIPTTPLTLSSATMTMPSTLPPIAIPTETVIPMIEAAQSSATFHDDEWSPHLYVLN